MMRRSLVFLGGMHTGGWSPGAQGQKHMTLCPTHFLYRIAGSKGPGYYMMKYWWTLGTFPTGMEAPFRLHEFWATYKQEHVPLEVEDWLCHFVKNPAEEIVPNAQKFMDLLEAVRDPVPTPYKKTHVTNVKPLKEAMDKFLSPLGVAAPATALRAVASSKTLKNDMLDLVYAYRSTVQEHGSTPHRRWAIADLQSLPEPGTNAGTLADPSRAQLEAVTSIVGQETVSKSMGELGFSENAAKQLGWVLDVDPNRTYPDETLLINTLTVLAKGSARIAHHEDAALTLTAALNFAHDDLSRGAVHSNIAAARCKAGDFRGAEWHAKEAVVLTDSAHSYAVWAASVAHQDRAKEAADIVKQGLTVHEADKNLAAMQDKLAVVAQKPDVPEEYRGIRARLPSQLTRGLAESPGISFGHEFDLVQFKGKSMPFKMDVRNNNMGSIFRRTGRDVNFRIATSQQLEPF